MAEFFQADLRRSRFEQVHLQDARFEQVHLQGARFHDVDLSGAQVRASLLEGVRMRGVEMVDVDIAGELVNVTINGVEIMPLVEAELDRRTPERVKMRPDDPDGFREAWDIVERLWAGTVERARRLPPDLLHESVDEEWSFIQTLRHLPFATDCWLSRAILGDPTPWDPLSLPWDEMPPTPGVAHARDARPDLDTVLELRLDRMGRVRSYLDQLDDATLTSHTVPVDAPGWPEPVSFEVRHCLRVILNEEWEHRRYAERDLAVLEARGS